MVGILPCVPWWVFPLCHNGGYSLFVTTVGIPSSLLCLMVGIPSSLLCLMVGVANPGCAHREEHRHRAA